MAPQGEGYNLGSMDKFLNFVEYRLVNLQVEKKKSFALKHSCDSFMYIQAYSRARVWPSLC